jgi:beta-lactam-binding protein with PASTA domain
MMPNVVGLEETQAKAILEAEGFTVNSIEYVSRRGIENADSTRVIRQRELGENSAELTVSHFKTQVSKE